MPTRINALKYKQKRVEPHTVNFTIESWKQIQTIAAETGVNYSDVVRHLLELGIALYLADTDQPAKEHAI